LHQQNLSTHSTKSSFVGYLLHIITPRECHVHPSPPVLINSILEVYDKRQLHMKFWLKIQKKRHHVEELHVHGKNILKGSHINRQKDMNEFIWLKTWTVTGSCKRKKEKIPKPIYSQNSSSKFYSNPGMLVLFE
jgi:hypothetical protein